jgi:D-alanine-D-alanine ligase
MEKMDGWRIALICNLKHNVVTEPDAPPDALAEYDSEETAEGIADSLRAAGHAVITLEADTTLLDNIRQAGVDICFNIAEGTRGDSREAQVPALLEMLGIPYTGAKVMAQAISLDKAMTKRLWRDHGLPTAPFQVFDRGEEPLARDLEFPLFVKPLREGSGKGIVPNSVVRDEAALREQVRWVVHNYRQPALVETYLPGREFTVGLFGNTLAPGELPLSPLYDDRGFHVLPILEIDLAPIAEANGIYDSHVKSDLPLGANYRCPAPVPESLTNEMKRLAVAAFEAIGALDFARVDFRLGANGRPYLMEINTLPGLNPTYSDIVLAARADGLLYVELVQEILSLAAHRYGMTTMVRAWEMPLVLAERRSTW